MNFYLQLKCLAPLKCNLLRFAFAYLLYFFSIYLSLSIFRVCFCFCRMSQMRRNKLRTRFAWWECLSLFFFSISRQFAYSHKKHYRIPAINSCFAPNALVEFVLVYMVYSCILLRTDKFNLFIFLFCCCLFRNYWWWWWWWCTFPKNGCQ